MTYIIAIVSCITIIGICHYFGILIQNAAREETVRSAHESKY